ncbi:pyruvate, water dikinase regulatory protein [uncultured Desulfuromusa sp.]|uniref:pyruvate, water dikinase regulatory protein n=1 Tax=uncultured Desulfuromusa sp. TaxID=219183 RepID=UPI002AA91540|nr:pyruvate, water dikinase regulatory protein [uncultured Desulfuromusa sp.]
MDNSNDQDHKKVFIISDGIGQSAMNVLKASLIQFDVPSSVLRVFSRIDNPDRIRGILEKAKEVNAFVAFTIAKHETREFVHKTCQEMELFYHDILGPPIEKLSTYLGVEPKESANLLRKVDSKYFERIDAIEFTMKYDDGQDVHKVYEADIIILGLSRTSKTPTSYLLAQQGYKVVNIPLMPEVPIPKEVFQVDQNRIVCLIMDSEVLQKIRRARIKHYKTESNYTDLGQIFNEMEMVYDLTKKNKQWHIVDTTNKSVEETAREIISMVFGQYQEF